LFESLGQLFLLIEEFTGEVSVGVELPQSSFHFSVFLVKFFNQSSFGTEDASGSVVGTSLRSKTTGKTVSGRMARAQILSGCTVGASLIPELLREITDTLALRIESFPGCGKLLGSSS
jgi:hypothetical protein